MLTLNQPGADAKLNGPVNRQEKTMKTLKDLADQQWRMIVDVSENTIDVCRPDPDRRGAWVGPLATVNVGSTEEDDDGEEVFDMTASSGRDAVAVALLPHFADLVCWAREQLESLNAIHFDSGSQSGRFHRELRDRLDWIIGCVDQRDERLASGTHGFHRFDEGKVKP